jgi:hypothetical protein
VNARDGDPITPGRLLAHKVGGHQAFQDGEAFITNGGQLGPQIEVILPGRYRINTDLFSVEVQPATVVTANQIGLVTAKDGAPLPPGELVAIRIEGHKDFQDGSAFLENGGRYDRSMTSSNRAHATSTPSCSFNRLTAAIAAQRVVVIVSNRQT